MTDSKTQTRRAPLVQRERHRGERAGWLRAAVLGADDGIVSVASLAIGVAASGSLSKCCGRSVCGCARGGCNVNGRRRVRLCQFTTRYRTRGH